MKNDFFFLTFILVLTLGLTVVSQRVHEIFGETADLRLRSKQTQKELASAQLRTALVAEKFFDYQQSVAATLGTSEINSPGKMNLLHVSRLPASGPNPAESAMLMARAKELFNHEKYNQSLPILREIEQRFSGSPATLEARFLQAESYYHLDQTEECVDVIAGMMNDYPESPLTGYLMLRLSQILHYRKRTAEALDILQIVEHSFASEANLKNQASLLLKRYRN
ncbi:MAG: hypothetical protein C5B49_11895 [Bdellovibrio sp.]|nr:MAG: hypothetical protein C5B49_11895 [Bdellovibrio sp.]